MDRAHDVNPRPYSKRRRYLFAVLVVSICGFGGYWIARFLDGAGNQQTVYTAVSLKSLGQFVFDDKAGVDTDIPAQYRALDGKKVSIEGFMFTPNIATSKVVSSQLIWSLRGYRGPPQVQDRVFLDAPPDKPMVRYDTSMLVSVRGTLHAKVLKDADGVYSVFRMTVDDVTPKN